MRVVIQRVLQSSVSISNNIVATIGKGLLVLIGIEDQDTQSDIDWLSKKIVNLRIFNDEAGIMNESIMENGGDIIVVSQFTLHASTKKGNRPTYIRASKPEVAIPLYNAFVKTLEQDLGRSVQTGVFGADMQITLINDGPVTIVVDTVNKE